MKIKEHGKSFIDKFKILMLKVQLQKDKIYG